MTSRYWVAVDVGGTFTDLVAVDHRSGELRVAKVPSTPPDFYAGVVAAMAKITEDFSQIELFVHGTTAHLNAFLERKGAPCALVTTRGFGDVYEMRRGARAAAYDLHFRYPSTLIPRRDVFEVSGRIDGKGRELEPIVASELDGVLSAVRARGLKSIAVCFLHSYRNPSHEQQVAEYLRERAPEIFVTPSSDVCREWREYERVSTVALNAYISPILGNYLRRLRGALGERRFSRKVHLMQSHGGLIGAENAETRGVLTLMSGPVGGNVGCRTLSRQIAEPNLICVDMGGTSFDISLVIEGESAVTSETSLAGQPILAPMVDIHTIGAGGGSIAYLDAGALRVGPQSAGAIPGPACYDRGGTEPTVTDANLVLGRLDEHRRFGGEVRMQPGLAQAAVGKLGAALGLGVQRMAEGILEVVNSQMANAIRTMTISRGIDPREFALVAFGGAGPMHAVFLAKELGIRRIIVPGAAGAFSAWGMLETEIRYDVAQTHIMPLKAIDAADLDRRFEAAEAELKGLLADEGVYSDRVRYIRSLDMRYAGQEHYITVALPETGTVDEQALRQQFDSMYRGIFGHSNLAEDVELVNLRARAQGPLPHEGGAGKPVSAYRVAAGRAEGKAEGVTRQVIFDGQAAATRFIERSAMTAGVPINGPVIIDEPSCTTVVPPGYRATELPAGHLLIEAEAHA